MHRKRVSQLDLIASIFFRNTCYLEEWFALVSLILRSFLSSSRVFDWSIEKVIVRSLLALNFFRGWATWILFVSRLPSLSICYAVEELIGAQRQLGKPDGKVAIAKAQRVTAESSIHNRWQPFQLCKISICQIDLPREESSISNLFR